VAALPQDEAFVALLNESGLAAESIAFGATILGRANYAMRGYYAQAFFSLSVGFERCGKLVLALDHALDHGGTFPSKKTLRSYGHDLGGLVDATDAVNVKRGLGAMLPGTDIHDGIITTLTDFATNVTRYYNLEAIGGDPTAMRQSSPIAAWYRKVDKPIAAAHYGPKRRDADEARAHALQLMTTGIASVRYYSEEGDLINSVFEASRRTAEREAVVPWERMYVLQFGRYFAAVLRDLGYAAHAAGVLVPHLSEFFGIFGNPDLYFRTKKIWSIYR
jgi:hypothetical protein